MSGWVRRLRPERDFLLIMVSIPLVFQEAGTNTTYLPVNNIILIDIEDLDKPTKPSQVTWQG